MFGSLGPQELLIILLIVIIIFGAKKLPDLGKSLCEGIKNFKDAIKGGPEPPPPADKSQQSQDPPVKIV